MRRILLPLATGVLMLLAGVQLGAQTQTLTMSAGVPPAPTGGATYTGAPGIASIYYWVVARYPAGYVYNNSPIVAGRTQGIGGLGSGNSVQVSWGSLTGATGYDVVRLATSWFNGSCSACVVVFNTSATSFTDSSSSTVGSYPPGGISPASPASAQESINNQNYPVPTPVFQTSWAGSFFVPFLGMTFTPGDCLKLQADFPFLLDSGLPCTSGGSGINQLTGDVLAGPGTGSQVAKVVGVEGASIPTNQAVVGTNGLGQIVAGVAGVPTATVSTLPASPSGNPTYLVTDGVNASDCVTGGGSTPVLCAWNGSVWNPGVGVPIVTVATAGSVLPFIATDGASPFDCTVGGGSFVVLCGPHGLGAGPIPHTFYYQIQNQGTPVTEEGIINLFDGTLVASDSAGTTQLGVNTTALPGYKKIETAGNVLPQEAALNFLSTLAGTVPGSSPCVDNSGNGSTDCSFMPSLVCASHSASTTTYTCSTSPVFVPAKGVQILWQPDVTNTGSVTLNVNGFGSTNVTKQAGIAALAAGDVQASPAQYVLLFDGTTWEMASQTGNGNRAMRAVLFDFGNYTSGSPALSASATACTLVNFSGTIVSASLVADQSGSVTVDVRTVAFGSYTGPSSTSTITAADTPALSSAVKEQDTTLTGWTTSLAANTEVCAFLSAPSTLAAVQLALSVSAN
jgi:hypothetical protein